MVQVCTWTTGCPLGYLGARSMSILPLELRRTDPIQTSEWLECLEQLIEVDGTAYASQLLERLLQRAAEMGVPLRHNTAYRNTIPPEHEFPFPGDLALE